MMLIFFNTNKLSEFLKNHRKSLTEQYHAKASCNALPDPQMTRKHDKEIAPRPYCDRLTYLKTFGKK